MFRAGLRVIVAASAVTIVWGLYSGLPSLWLTITGFTVAEFLSKAQRGGRSRLAGRSVVGFHLLPGRA